MSKDVHKPSGLGRQLVIGIILVGMIIGSAIATSNLATSGLVGDLWGFRSAWPNSGMSWPWSPPS